MRNIEKIYKEYFDIVYKYLIYLTHDKELSEDLAQETFIKMIKYIDKFEGKSKLSSWLCEISKNLYFDYLRKNKKKKLVENKLNDIEIQSNQNIESEYIEKEDECTLFEKIDSLDEITKRIIYLRIKGELSFKEIGEIIGKSENWVRVNYFRGKQKVKEELDDGKE